jgi:branched-chain amino acid transport system ATP-binding protein
MAVVGRNGVGKTTLMHAVMGMHPASSGRVLVNGVDLIPLPAYRRRDHGLALVPQGRRLFRTLTVREHLQLVKPIRSEPLNLESLSELFPSLFDRLDAPASTLSGGERSMLSIARALIVNPYFLLMDEPTEGLAPMLIGAIADVFPRMREAGLTVLLIEQNLQFALSVADRLAVMERGEIIHEFDRDEVEDISELSDLILAPKREAIPGSHFFTNEKAPYYDRFSLPSTASF